MRTKTGFSLIELLITVAISSVMSMTFASMMVFQFNQQSNVEEKLNTLNAQTSLSNVLQQSATCKAVFQLAPPLGFGTAVTLNPPPGPPITVALPATAAIYTYDTLTAPPTPIGLVAQAGQLLPGSQKIKVAAGGMKFINVATSSPNVVSAQLEVTFSNVGSGTTPKPWVSQTLFLSTSAAHTVTSCSAGSPIITTVQLGNHCNSPLPAGCSSSGGTWTWMMSYAAFALSNLEFETGSSAVDGTKPWPMCGTIYPGCGAPCYNGIAWCFRN